MLSSLSLLVASPAACYWCWASAESQTDGGDGWKHAAAAAPANLYAGRAVPARLSCQRPFALPALSRVPALVNLDIAVGFFFLSSSLTI
jgi:hypothetical protein